MECREAGTFSRAVTVAWLWCRKLSKPRGFFAIGPNLAVFFFVSSKDKAVEGEADADETDETRN